MAHIEAGRCLLNQLRKTKGITQENLAELTSIARSTISAYENNRYVMTLEDAKSISDKIGCAIDDLYNWKFVDR